MNSDLTFEDDNDFLTLAPYDMGINSDSRKLSFALHVYVLVSNETVGLKCVEYSQVQGTVGE